MYFYGVNKYLFVQSGVMIFIILEKEFRFVTKYASYDRYMFSHVMPATHYRSTDNLLLLQKRKH